MERQPVTASYPIEPGAGQPALDALWAWAVKETAGWQTSRPDRQTAYTKFREINESEREAFILKISDGNVTISHKEGEIFTDELQKNPRIHMYRDYIEDVVTRFCPGLRTELLIDVSDARRRNEAFPVFVFQKPLGCGEILLPDVDFFHSGFYGSVRDDIPYHQKSCSAIFVGSTSGGHLTAQTVSELSLPRLRSAVYFKDNPNVKFYLPNIVQYDNEDTKRIVEEMSLGGEGRIGWNEQFQNKFVLSLDGNGATCSRVVIALKSNCVLLKYDSPHELYYFSGLEPWVHYIPISADSEVERIIEAERRRPGIFEHIAAAGRRFANRYLTRYATMLYTSLILELYNSTFSDHTDALYMLGSRVGTGEVVIRPQQTPIAGVMCHIENAGDRWFDGDQWAGIPGSGQSLEGLLFEPTAGVSADDLMYQALYADNTASQVGIGGEFVGTINQHRPITGFWMRLCGALAREFEGSYQASFTDGSSTDPVTLGDVCESATGAPLEALLVTLRRCRPTAPAGPEPEASTESTISHTISDRPGESSGRSDVLGRHLFHKTVRSTFAHRGVIYTDFMRILDEKLHPRSYLEIGTHRGDSVASWRCDSICIDPEFRIDRDVIGSKRRSILFQMTSDEFFREHHTATFFPDGVDVAFLDGMHLFEYLLRDFVNVEKCSHSRSVILLHDCLPTNLRMAEREYRFDESEDSSTRGAWTGDVWRILPILKRYRPDLCLFLLDCPPTGLVACVNPDPNSRVLAESYPAIVEEFSGIDLETYGIDRLWGSAAMIDTRALAAMPEHVATLFGRF